ncbi:peptidoglycan D,D-transpeptidase FtsI family protein [Lichenicoccus roseus]
MRVRLLSVAGGFGVLFGAVGLKLTLATVLHPMAPAPRQIAPQVPRLPTNPADPKGLMADDLSLSHVRRATVTDRNGQILAISLPMAAVFANPLELMDPKDAAQKLKAILPTLDVDDVVRRLSGKKQFVYIAREIPPEKELAINDLGIPGIYFEPGEKRRYPLGRTAAQIMGAVDVDDHGVAGVERYFDHRLTSDSKPLRLSLDVRVQAVVRDELAAAKTEFQAIGACAIVMDVRTGEVVAMVSLPDYDANLFNHATDDQRFNRAVTGMYEPGSTFKLQTAAMALQDNVAHVWDRFSTIPIHVGRYTISDMKTDHFAPWLSMPEVMAYSSNPAAAHIALDVGAKRQQDWLRAMGFFARVPIELPEAGHPIIPSVARWGQSTVMTVGFGHGVAEPPLAIVRGTAAAANGGVLVKPTLIARPEPAETQDDRQASTLFSPAGAATPAGGYQDVSAHLPLSDGPASRDNSDVVGGEAEIVPEGPKLLSDANSLLLRKMLRLVVTKGIGKSAEVPGYFVGGKTGTAEKVGARGGYLKHVNISAFTGIFPMNTPRYAVYVMLDSPMATKATHGWTTAAWNAAPTVAKIVARIGPMLSLFPAADTAAIDAALDIPMQPATPSGARELGPGNDPGDPHDEARSRQHVATRHDAKPDLERLRQTISWRDAHPARRDASDGSLKTSRDASGSLKTSRDASDGSLKTSRDASR